MTFVLTEPSSRRFCVKMATSFALAGLMSWAMVLKRFVSWATFVFQKPFAGHKN